MGTPVERACKRAKVIAISIAVFFIFSELTAFFTNRLTSKEGFGLPKDTMSFNEEMGIICSYSYYNYTINYLVLLSIGTFLEGLTILALVTRKKCFLIFALVYSALLLLLILGSFVVFDDLMRINNRNATELQLVITSVITVFLQFIALILHIIRFINVGIVYNFPRNKERETAYFKNRRVSSLTEVEMRFLTDPDLVSS